MDCNNDQSLKLLFEAFFVHQSVAKRPPAVFKAIAGAYLSFVGVRVFIVGDSVGMGGL